MYSYEKEKPEIFTESGQQMFLAIRDNAFRRRGKMYSYEKEKPEIFTESGQQMFLAIRDNAFRLLRDSGAATMDSLMKGAGSGDSWQMMACVDRMVEIGDLREIKYGECAGQHRIFVRSGTNRF